MLGLASFLALLHSASGQTNLQRLASFGVGSLTGTNVGDSVEVYGPLTEAGDGRIYGLTPRGGTNGGGTLFGMNKNGTGISVLHNFPDRSQPGVLDGIYPSGCKLLKASDGFLYGTTPEGDGATTVRGTIFKVSTNGTGYTNIVSFSNALASTRGIFPSGKLSEGADGLLYGGTDSGGANNDGVIFKVNKNGTGYTVLYHLNELTNIGVADLFASKDGFVYGASSAGGSQNSGGFFRLTTNGSSFTVLRQFTGSFGDGSDPHIFEGSDGKLYGAVTTYNADIGRVFRMDKNGGNFTVLHAFAGAPGDGSFPNGVAELNGMLYGTTFIGGNSNAGSIYRIGMDGTGYTVLHEFDIVDDTGYIPTAAPFIGSDGAIYGTTIYGSDVDSGTIFRLSDDFPGGLPPIDYSLQPSDTLRLSWPHNFIGWRLQAQTNSPGIGVTPSWVVVPNSGTTNFWQLPMNHAAGSVFYRLIPP